MSSMTPRAVRNFYIEGRIDGRESPIAGGPRNKEGGMQFYITQRKNGEVRHACSVQCFEAGGVLTTTVYDGEGNKIFQYATER